MPKVEINYADKTHLKCYVYAVECIIYSSKPKLNRTRKVEIKPADNTQRTIYSPELRLLS